MFERLALLIGTDNLNKIEEKTILIVGVGGVGGYVATSLARSGVRNLIIMDFDTIDITNINRQITAYSSTIGLKKVDVLEKMLLDINPNMNVIKYDTFLNSENINVIFDRHKIDYIVDACYTINTKKDIIQYGLTKYIPFINSM